MPKLQIPDRYRRVIARLAEYSEEQVASIEAALKAATTTASARIAASIEPPLDDAEDLIDSILPLYERPGELNVSREQFLRDVVESVRTEWADRAPADITSAETRLHERIDRLSRLEEVAILVKTTDILNDYERPFQSARILSDLRPVFGKLVAAPVAGMGVVHTLKVTFSTADGRDEDIYFALTSGDLANLRSAVERAEAKAAALREQLTAAGIRYLEGE